MLILSFVLSSFIASAAKKDSPPAAQEIMITTTPPTSAMKVSGLYVISGGIPTYDRRGEITTFPDALNDFIVHMKKRIEEIARKNNDKGACNLKISHSVTDKMYYFTATFDFFK
jgi:hypothetical protein